MSFSSRTLALLIATAEIAVALAGVLTFEFLFGADPVSEEESAAEAPKEVPSATEVPPKAEEGKEAADPATGQKTEEKAKEKK